MKVGDLVRCISANRVVGLIVAVKPNVHSTVTKRSVFNVLLGKDVYPFRGDMLEVINESR